MWTPSSRRRAKAAVIATSTESEARRACTRAGLDPVVTLSRSDCASGLLRSRRKVAESGAGVVAIHTYDWDRQSLQPLFEMASAVMPCELRLVVVGDGRDVMQLSNARLWLDLVTIPAVCMSSAWRVTGEVRRFGRLRRAQAPPQRCWILTGAG